MTTPSLYVVRAAILACVLMVLVQAQEDERSPPSFTDPVKAETRYFFKNNKVTVKCRAEGNPTPTYKWMRNGKPLISNDYVGFNHQSGDLTFTSMTEREEGIYMCIATNRFESNREAASMSPPLDIKTVRVDQFKAQTVQDESGMAYSYMKFDCRDQGVIQVRNIYYNWYDGTKSKQLEADDRRFIDSKGALHFTYLLTTDADVDVYRCGASNSKTSIVLGSPTRLTVVENQGVAAVRPVFQHSNDNLTAMLYTDATLECFFSGYQPGVPNVPTIKWFDDASKEIQPGASDSRYKLSEDKRKLTIKNVQITDEKNYYCQAENIQGMTQKQPVFLNVVAAPIFLQENGAPKDLTMPEGDNAVFHCNTKSLPNEKAPNTPIWYINANPTGSHTDTTKYSFSPDKKMLTIKRLSKATDIQCVTCEVTNEYGSTWGDACLNVILAIVVTQRPAAVQEIKKGDVIDLSISATTDPTQTLGYKWIFNNKTVLRPPFAFIDNQVAYINTSELTQDEFESLSGTYRRIIYNPYDEEIVDVEVRLKGLATPAPVVAKGGMDVWLIGLIVGILFLIIVIIIIIFVICRKKQEGDYNVDKKETGAGLDPEKELKEKGFDDYSRPTYDDYEYPEKKPRGELEYDDVPIGGDDESLAEYGDEADTHFNEDGSFIGIYQNKNGTRQPNPTESTF